MQQVDDPPFLPVGTEVSAKYKGAFCEAKVRKVVRNIKCKVAYKQGLGSGTVSDELIKGVLRVGATVEVKHPDKREYVEATITKIQDCSQYTVVFDDGDITTLRRTALCLKSGRHFNESETLDQLPLTHPEHFGNPVIGGRRGRRHLQDDSSDEDDDNDSKEVVNEKEEHIGKVVCVESTETKKKDKEKWFPALVVSPTAQVTVRIRVKDEYLVRSFKDGRYYTVPKKEATEFTRDMAAKQDGMAVQAALQYLDNSTLPPHWDKDALFGLANSSSEYEGEFDSDSSDDEPREEKDLFVAQLYKYMDDRGTPLNKVPSITNRDVDLYRLFRAVQKLGGYNRVTSQNQWKAITTRLGFLPVTVSVTNLVKQAYKKFLQPFEEFNRKLGCSMSMTPRNANRSKGRSLVRANSVASPKPEPKEPKAAILIPPPVLDDLESESSNDVTKSKRKLSTGSGKVKALVDKIEEKVKEEPIEPTPSKSSKVSNREEPTATISIPSSSVVGSAKKEAKKKAAPIGQDEKKPNRKRKEGGSGDSEKQPVTTDGPSDKDKEKEFPIEVGDKLSVYYHEKKVTYEAKVIETSLQQGVPFYLVHYTGWNTRYDEWVPRERIAENLTANKAKRGKTSSTNQKAASNVPPNDGTKGTPANADKASSATLAPTSTPSGKSLSASKRGRGRSDSGPPRSVTPSSMASSSSRTKSPAATTSRRTTRGQPSTSRRESNNISDISMQTDSDSDSDTPVKKPVKSPAAQTSTAASSPGSLTLKATPSKSTIGASNSPSDTEEEEMASCSAKARDYDLNQIRSELKGFKELKSPSPESESNTQTTDGDKKPGNVFDFDLSEDLGKKSSTDSKTSSTDLSSETESFNDDDSQSSDKTTMLENMTEKFQQKIAHDKRLERMNSGGSDKISTKTSSIEKIIEDTLAEKKQESMKSKPFAIEKNLFKPVEVDGKQEPATIEMKPPIRDRKLLKPSTLTDKKLSEPGLTAEIETSITKFEKKVTALVADSIISPIKKEQPMMKKDLTVIKKEPSAELTSSEIPLKEGSALNAQSDIYEFKEPEPFEFETRKGLATNLNSPDVEKKNKKPVPKSPVEITSDNKPPPPTTPIVAKKNKKSPVKDPDKTKIAKIDDKPPLSILEPVGLLTPNKVDTFDALRKSPSFNLNLSLSNEEGSMLLFSQDPPKLFSEQVEKSPPIIASTSGESAKKIPFISPFVETLKDSPKAFDLKADVSAIESPDKLTKATELEQVKRVLALDPVLPFEPPKVVDKGKFSIADKVLQKLNQKKQEEQKPKEEPLEEPQPQPLSVAQPAPQQPTTSQQSLCPPIIEAPQISLFPLIEPPKIELPAIIKKEIEIPLKKPILSSPEPKLDILESIAPKNNDLSETIQKLESVIRNRTEVERFDEDSSDSTDSERRLVIEDDSHSSETNQTDFGYDTEPKKPTIFAEENLFSSSRDGGAFRIVSPSIQPTAFSIQTSSVSSSTHPVDVKTDLVSSSVFKTIDVEHVTIKVDKILPELHIQTTTAAASSFAIKKEELSPTQDTTSITHNEAINLLLCEETIPGSPAPPKEPADIKPNVHPIDSDIKHIPMDIECSIQPTSDAMGGAAGHGGGGSGGSDKVKAESNTPTSSPRDSLSQDESSEDLRKVHGQDSMASPKKRRITRKHSECGEQMSKRRRHNVNISKRNNGSDSDDNSDANNSQRSIRSNRPCQYNFLVELDSSMSPNQRISILNKTIAELRKTYNMIKSELASIDRRRKKIRRREREKKLQQKLHC